MAHLGILSTPVSKSRLVWVLVLAFLAALVWASSAGAAVTQKQAASRAVDALGSEKGSSAVIVFGLPTPISAGTPITQAGTAKPSKGSTGGLNSKLRTAGVTLVRAPSVLRASRRSYFFYEDRGPFQLYQHPGRVALVDVATGRVTVSRTINWPPLISGRLPAFLKAFGAYRSSKYQVFYRPWTVPGATQQKRSNRNLFDEDPFGPGRPLPSKTNSKAIANRLAAERSCILRVTDTLPAFWNAQALNLTRSYVGTLFEQLERDNTAFVDDRYGARSGETLAKAVDRLIAAGCKDILLYIAGQGYSSAGEPVIHLGTAVQPGGMVAQQNISATDLRNLVSGRPGVTFKFKIDAPYSGGMVDRLKSVPNVLLVETPSAPGDEAFASIPEVRNSSGQMINSSNNPAGLLEFTNCELVGLKAFFDSAEEIDKATQGQNEGVSFLAEMLARAQELCAGSAGFADDLGAAPQLYAAKRASGNGTNRPPKAEKGDVTVTEDTPTSIPLVASDPDGDPLTYTITKNPDHGTLSGSGASRTYTPNANYVGPDDFSFKAEDSKGASNTARVDITVVAANDPPVVTNTSGNTAYVEGAPAVVIDNGLTVSDTDDTEVSEATVRIHEDDFHPGDVLEYVFLPGDPITAFYDTGTGLLTLTATTPSGTVPIADMQAALRTVTYRSTHDAPKTPTRIQFRVDDGEGLGPAGVKNMAISNVNDGPAVDTSDVALDYAEDSGPQPVDPFISVTDPDSDNLSGATVSISSNFNSGQDSLHFTNQNGITGTYNSGTGVLTLTGTASVTDYATAIQSVAYANSSNNPSTATRTVSFTVTDTGPLPSNTDTRDINITPSNDAPVVTTTVGNTAYTEGNPGTVIDGGLTVTDADDTNSEGAVVRISANFESGDDLTFVNQLGISGTYNTGTGVLTLTGTASVSDYQTALRSITFDNTIDDNLGTPKTVEFKVNDGDVDSAAATKNIAITGVNDNPTLTASGGSASYTEGGSAVAVDPGITATDPDSINLAGATVSITANFSSADGDILNFTNQNGISGTYNSGTGVLTLSGSATVANYQTALRSITYSNTSDNPSTATRTVSFQADDGGAVDNLSNVVTRDVTVAGVNDAPVVTTSGGNTAYTEGAAATPVDGALTVTDADDTNIEGGQVRISANFESGDDLVFVNQNGISGTYNTGTGVLTLSGTSSKANYQTALRSIAYQNATDDNLGTPKTVEFKVNDGDVDSAPATKNIAITGVNDNPVLTASGGSASYTEGGSAVAVDPGITATDPDSINLAGATVSITANFSSADGDILNFTNQNGISGTYNSGTGVLTLSGSATVANYQTALRSITYSNTSDNPSTATRTVSFQADDGGAVDNLSNVATRDVTVAGANDPPVVDTSAGATAYTEGDPSTTIDGALTVSDADDTNIEGGQVRISVGFQSGDDLVFVNQAGISGVYNSGTGVLTLSGTASKSDYQTALRSIGFQHTGNDPQGGKTVEFKINDGDVDSATDTKTINITGVNDGPVLTTTAAALSYTEGDGAVAADNGLTLDDPENHNITGATVEISAGHVQADDELAFTNQLGITGAYNDSTGVLTLSGTTSESNYQTALRSVTYENSNPNPSGSKTVRFQTTGDTGSPSQASNTATRNINLAGANDAPVVTPTNGSTPYTEGGAAATIDSGVTVTDADDTNLEGGQVRISSGFQSGDDLVFVNQNGISGVYNTGTGVLTLSGTSSVANYQTALQSIQFQTTNDNPVASKTIEFKVNDGDVDSNTPTKEITVTPVNDNPTLTTSGGSAAFVEDTSGPVAVDGNLTLTDPDSTNMSGATVSITTNFDSSEDELQFTNQNGISGVYNSGTGVLTLSGSATVGNYQTALRSVQYNNTDTVAPNTATRTVSFQATDSSSGPSNTATRDVTVQSVNDAPVVDTTDTAQTWTEDDPPKIIDSGVTVTDQDDTNLEGGQVRISSGFQSGDDLIFVNQNGISGVYNSGTGVLTLSGTSSVANYQTALQSIQFQHVGNNPNTLKTIEFKVNDGDVDSNLATRDINVTATNDGPVVDATNAALTYTENDLATAVDNGLTIDDLENDNLSGGSASITANYQAGQDFLNWSDNNLFDNITLDNINSSQQTIVLTGIDDESKYQAALRAVTYQNGSENPSNVARTVTFSATDQPGLTGSDTRTINVTPVDDPPAAQNDPSAEVTAAETTVLEDANATNVPVLENDDDPDGGPMSITSVSDPTNGAVVITGGGTGLTYKPDANYCNDAAPSDTFTYTLNGSVAPAQTATVSMTVTCVNDVPVAGDETTEFNSASTGAVGNTSLVGNDPTDPAPTPADPTDTGAGADRPHRVTTGDVLADDTDVENEPLSVVAGPFPTTKGGSVTLESDGDFTYEPPASTSCDGTSDTFSYTVTDNNGGTPGGTPSTDNVGVVTVDWTDCVWYVNNHDAGGNSGTSAAPFDTIQQAETASGVGPPNTIGSVYVYDGNNTNSGYTTGLNMDSGEKLVGEAADLVVASTTLQQEDNSKRPQLTDTTGDVVALDDGNTVTGVELDPTGAFSGIAGASGDTGGGTIADVRIIDTGVAATNAQLELISTTGTFNISDLTINNLAAAGQNGGSKGVELSNAGTVNFTPTGTISVTTTGGAGLDATSTNLGTSTFDTITTSSSSTGGVVLVNTTNPVGGSTTFGDLSLTTTSGSTAAFRASSAGTIIVPSGGTANVSATGGPGVDVSSTAGAQLNFDDVDSTNSANDGINLDGLGNGVFNASSGDIGGAAGISFDLNDGDGAISYPGNLNNGSGAHAIQVTSRDGGTVTISGPISDTNDAGGGFDLASNSGGSTTISNGTKQINTTGGAVSPTNQGVVMNASDGHTLILSGGGLDIDTTNGKGLEADTSGTIEVSGSGNTIDTTTGTPLNISNTDIANGDVTFQRIASNGAAQGIRLNNTTNASGSFTVQSSGSGTCTFADTSGCSGGSIVSSTSDTGAGIDLNSVPGGVSLTRMRVANGQDDGIAATSVTDLDLSTSVITGNGNNHAGTQEERGLDYLNVSGTPSITNTHVASSDDSNAHLRNTSSAATTYTVTGSTFDDSKFNTGLRIRSEGTSNVTATVTGNVFSRNADPAFSMQADLVTGTVNQTLTLDNNDLSGGSPTNPVSARPQVSINAGGNSIVKATVTNNDIKSGAGSEVILNTTATHTGTFDIKATGNDINDAQPGALDALADGGSSIHGWAHGDGVNRMEIRNNNLANWGGRAMELSHNDGTGDSDYTVTNNVIGLGDQGVNNFEGIYLFSGGVGGDAADVCIDMENNDMDGIGFNGVSDIALDKFTGNILRFADYNDATPTVGELQTNLRGKNPLSPALTVETFSQQPNSTTDTACDLSVGTP